MSLDTSLLRLLKTREQYERLYSVVPKDGIDEKTAVLLKDYGLYFKENPEAKGIKTGPFMTFFRLLHPKLKPEQVSIYKAVIKDIQQPAPPGTEDGIRERLVSLRTATQLQTMLEQFDEGELDLTAALRIVADRHENWVGRERIHPKVKDRIEDILKAEEDDWGFKWRLPCLNRSLLPLRGGDFYIVAARVDSGKSSFFASELSCMARQVDELYPGQDRTIIILNNEGPGKKLKHRFYNAALQRTTPELVELMKAGTIYEKYVDAQGGRDLFYVFDVHDYTMSQLEDIVKDLNPAIIIVDMLDNVQMDSVASNGGTRTDQLLEAMYQRARIWGVKYDAAVIATSQLNGDADGELFPKLSMLANSRTGKAGAADVVIMLGRSSNPDLDNCRFISLPKNKRHRSSGPKDPRQEVFFDGPRALFNEASE